MAVEAKPDQVLQGTGAEVEQEVLVRLDPVARGSPFRMHVGAGTEHDQAHDNPPFPMLASHVKLLKPEFLTPRKMTLITADDACHMRSALDEAEVAAAMGEVPIGAVLVTGGLIVARGHNERESRQDPTAHAEMIAIRAAADASSSWRLVGSTLYVTMEPCAMCIGAVVLARVERVVFGVCDPKAGACGSVLNVPEERRLNHHIEVVGGVLEEESRALLQEFFQGLREKEEIA